MVRQCDLFAPRRTSRSQPIRLLPPISDGTCGTATQVSVTINAVNDAPWLISHATDKRRQRSPTSVLTKIPDLDWRFPFVSVRDAGWPTIVNEQLEQRFLTPRRGTSNGNRLGHITTKTYSTVTAVL